MRDTNFLNKTQRVKPQKGFTLIEVTLVMLVLGLIFFLSNQAFSAYLHNQMRSETKSRMKAIQEAIVAAYSNEAWDIDNNDGAVIQFSEGVLRPGRSDKTTFKMITPSTQIAAEKLQYDGFNAPWYIYVTSRQVALIDGQQIPYHKIVIVSAGGDEELTTTVSSKGEVTHDEYSNDLYFVIDGLSIEKNLLEQNQKRLERVEKNYQQYFQARYLSDPDRNVGRNYFAEGDQFWDQQPGAMKQVTTFSDLSDIAKDLGLTPGEIQDAYHQNIQYLNSGDRVRNPQNPTMGTPPYTALLRVRVPGGGELLRTVSGIY